MAAAEIQLPAPGVPTGPLSDDLLRDPAMSSLLDAVRSHLGVGTVFISRYVEGGAHEVTHALGDGASPWRVGAREPVEQSYGWHALEGRLPELLTDAADHPFARTLPITSSLPVGCHLAVPIALPDGSVWGSLCAVDRAPDATLSPRDLAVVRAFAGMAAERIAASINAEQDNAQVRARVEQMLDGHAITIFHQPIHSLSDDSPVGVECLARFPGNNKRGAGAWFEDAEKVGLGTELELAAVRCALDTLAHVPAGKYAAVNVSPRTILSGRLEAELDNFDCAKLVIELTEHHRIADFDALARRISRLKEQVRIAIDDVGTGYAGLRHIVGLKPDILKMDMALTRDVHRDPARRALTGALVQLAHDIGCDLVAEGIETRDERDAMAELGVSCGQGWFYARPLPVVAAERHLLSGGTDVEPDLAEFDARPAPREVDAPPLRAVAAGG